MGDTKISVNAEQIGKAIKTGVPLVLTTYTFPKGVEQYVDAVISEFLKQLDQEQMCDTISFCMKELAKNGKKANTKRVYFDEKGLDLSNAADYESGMKSFKEETLNNQDYWVTLQKNKGLYIKITLQAINNKVRLEVRNKSELNVYEYKRIHDKITRATMFDSIEDGMVALLDESEGAGLGLTMMVLMLKEIGLTEENYQVLSENGETITRLILPFSERSRETFTRLSKKFVELIKGLPEFPENIMAINRLINDPASTMGDIARKISNDVSLTGELLKLVNSAAFALSTPCSDIAEATKLVGIRGIRNLLFSIGSMKSLMVDSNPQKKKLWDHSYRVAFYAYTLARRYMKGGEDKSVVEDSYVCGLLHDMGKIVFVTATHDMYDKLNQICERKEVAPVMFERMISGVNHGEVGALIAEKWNFPDAIVNTIRYHHDTASAPKELQKLVYLIHFCDLLDHYSDGIIDWSNFDAYELELFSITNEVQLKELSEQLHMQFKNGER